jgi:hypothetical protein
VRARRDLYLLILEFSLAKKTDQPARLRTLRDGAHVSAVLVLSRIVFPVEMRIVVLGVK